MWSNRIGMVVYGWSVATGRAIQQGIMEARLDEFPKASPDSAEGR
jgi:hypothetical protein